MITFHTDQLPHLNWESYLGWVVGILGIKIGVSDFPKMTDVLSELTVEINVPRYRTIENKPVVEYCTKPQSSILPESACHRASWGRAAHD